MQICLGEFDDLLDNSSDNHLDSTEKICIVYSSVKTPSFTPLNTNGSMIGESSNKTVDLENLTLVTPENATLLLDLTLTIYEKEHLLASNSAGGLNFLVIMLIVWLNI